MIVALTTASLDITLGIAWWTLKQAVTGVIYLGTYLFSESSTSKKNKILGDDPNFVPHAFPIIELQLAHAHTTINKTDASINEFTNSDEDFIHITKTESILTSTDKYFKIPLLEIIKRKTNLPLWIVPFLNTYPLTNYAIVMNSDSSFLIKTIDNPIFSPFKLNIHLNLQHNSDLFVYINKDDIETVISNIQSKI